MLNLSPSHMQVLSDAALERFEDKMVLHLQKTFPRATDGMGESGLREEIRMGVRKAISHNMTSECEACKYIELMFVCGSDFDTVEPWLSVFRLSANRPLFDRRIDEVYDAFLAGVTRRQE